MFQRVRCAVCWISKGKYALCYQYSRSSEFTPAMDRTFTELSSRKLLGASQLVSLVEHVCGFINKCLPIKNFPFKFETPKIQPSIKSPDNGKRSLPNIHIGVFPGQLLDGKIGAWRELLNVLRAYKRDGMIFYMGTLCASHRCGILTEHDEPFDLHLKWSKEEIVTPKTTTIDQL